MRVPLVSRSATSACPTCRTRVAVPAQDWLRTSVIYAARSIAVLSIILFLFGYLLGDEAGTLLVSGIYVMLRGLQIHEEFRHGLARCRPCKVSWQTVEAD